MIHGIAFVSLGFLVGNIAGMSASPVAATVIASVFTLAGGSALALFQKLQEADIKRASQSIAAFSVSCLFGLYVGILVTEYQLLSPTNQQSETQSATADTRWDKKYVRTSEINNIDLEYLREREAAKTVEERAVAATKAYAKLLETLLKNK